MDSGCFRFDRFAIDPAGRQLMRDNVPVELNGRYFDALALLVQEAGKLVSKDRFLSDVWQGVPVTDEALTQCVKTLRRRLGDNAASPRFIETVPKYGYRFIAPVERIDDTHVPPVVDPVVPATPGRPDKWREFFLLGGAGTLGAGVAGVIGGLFYGFAGASQPLAPGLGAASVLLVLLWLTLAAALMGGAGVSFGIAAGALAASPWGRVVGGALGGFFVGGVVKLLGLDAFNLLLGRSPGDITGGPEGVALGAAVGLGTWMAVNRSTTRSLRRSVALASLTGGLIGLLIPLLGGRLMGGSLDLLARTFPDSRLRLDPIGTLFGEKGFGLISQIVTGGLEGALFGGCIVGAMLIARRSLEANA